ncbi:MAG: hypothetical protein ACAH83_12180 [Alphaproteobacteria bacterium]
MANNLDELKEELYEAFGKAVGNADYPYSNTGSPEATKAAAMSLQAAAELARSIVAVEREITDRNDKKDGPKLPGKA